MDKEKEMRSLEVNLTQEEVKAYARTLAIETENRNDLKSEAKKVAKVYADNIKEKEAEIATIARAVHTEKEFREVECRWEFNYATNTKTLVRLDTFETVTTKVISAEERQIYMDGMNAAEKVSASEVDTEGM